MWQNFANLVILRVDSQPVTKKADHDLGFSGPLTPVKVFPPLTAAKIFRPLTPLQGFPPLAVGEQFPAIGATCLFYLTRAWHPFSCFSFCQKQKMSMSLVTNICHIVFIAVIKKGNVAELSKLEGLVPRKVTTRKTRSQRRALINWLQAAHQAWPHRRSPSIHERAPPLWSPNVLTAAMLQTRRND